MAEIDCSFAWWKAGSVWKISLKVTAAHGYGCEWTNHFVWLSDLAAELKAVTPMLGKRFRDAVYLYFCLLTEKEPTAHRTKYKFTFFVMTMWQCTETLQPDIGIYT